MITAFMWSAVQTTTAHYSPPVDAVPTMDVGTLFQHTSSRNQRVITQAVDFVISMQSAPTCTRLAASHLMNECRLLEHAPDFAKSRPEAYLDNIKTEYAAKLAVCELISAQPQNPVPPPQCEILVPSSKACAKGGRWWYSGADISNDKQCYPTFKMYQYTKCLESLQSKPQFWTSFSNAKQNAVVMCQASRDAIERENQLGVFKNLTQVLGSITSAMQESAAEYESLIKEQKAFSENAQKANKMFKRDIDSLNKQAATIATALSNKFDTFMKDSTEQLIVALANSQNAEIERIRQRMEGFSQELMSESSGLSNFFRVQLEHHHAIALQSILESHEAQAKSYSVLSTHAENLQNTVQKTNEGANGSLVVMEIIAQRLNTFESQTESMAEGFAFLKAILAVITFLVRSSVAIIGTMFLFAAVYKHNSQLAMYIAGALSSGFLLYTCGFFDRLGNIPLSIARLRSQSPGDLVGSLSPAQMGTAIGLLVWLGAYPIVCINSYVAVLLETLINKLIKPRFLREYENEGGVGLLPSIEVPTNALHVKHEVSLESTDRYSGIWT